MIIDCRTPTPVKEIINNEFGNKFEEESMKNYEKLISIVYLQSSFQKVYPNEKNQSLNTKSDIKIVSKTKKEEDYKTSTVVKSKKYIDVKSKVKENINSFKTSDNLNELINKVEKEIKHLETEKKKN